MQRPSLFTHLNNMNIGAEFTILQIFVRNQIPLIYICLIYSLLCSIREHFTFISDHSDIQIKNNKHIQDIEAHHSS